MIMLYIYQIKELRMQQHGSKYFDPDPPPPPDPGGQNSTFSEHGQMQQNGSKYPPIPDPRGQNSLFSKAGQVIHIKL